MRGETSLRCSHFIISVFQSTPLMRGETRPRKKSGLSREFQSTPLMRGETSLNPRPEAIPSISIHSPHARGDAITYHVLATDEISIHSPHARGDFTKPAPGGHPFDFNPLPSCEGRRAGNFIFAGPHNFNPLPSCEGRRYPA